MQTIDTNIGNLTLIKDESDVTQFFKDRYMIPDKNSFPGSYPVLAFWSEDDYCYGPTPQYLSVSDISAMNNLINGSNSP